MNIIKFLTEIISPVCLVKKFVILSKLFLLQRIINLSLQATPARITTHYNSRGLKKMIGKENVNVLWLWINMVESTSAELIDLLCLTWIVVKLT
ncbi:hypothetical protein [Candidatus Nitrosocosmicus arcticus]|uniref:hypothetical protein n=1 Tax=Candidatus Nitrosocosmicus arcticus TaxID=2035267 RepID=UPI001C942FB8|nr:hypothetical protein [Candidatus Nitrosocosmicus arcticus]